MNTITFFQARRIVLNADQDYVSFLREVGSYAFYPRQSVLGWIHATD